MSPLLEVSGLKTHIKLRTSTVHAVDGLSFTVDAGETVGIVGESGSGKTMAAMSIMKLLPPAARVVGGQINFDGRDLAQLSDRDIRKVRGNDIAMIFQDPLTSLNPTMNIGNQIAEAVVLHKGASKSDGLKRAAEVLELVGLPRPKERLKDYPHQLSGGLRQRVMIAMALSCDPKLLIADEPTTALDVTIQAQILSLLDRIKREIGMGIILITHDMGVIAGRTDRVVVMYAGEKVETAETDELFTHVRHPYTEALLASIPKLDQDKTQALYSIPGIPPDLRQELTACRFAPRCAFATEKCRTETPRLVEDTPGHEYQCFFPRQSSVEDITAAAEELLEQVEHNEALLEEFGSDIAILNTTDADADAADVPAVDAPFVLEFRDVVKEFPISRGFLGRNPTVLHAVSNVTIGVHKGETFGLVGESGCGKTTLGRMGTALEDPSGGRILFNGENLSELKGSELRDKRRNIQFMFQDPYASLDPRMRVQEIISEPLTVARRGTAAERTERVRGLMNEVGLPQDALDRYPHEFSGGQRQRLGLARAMALNPQVIIADEPVSALDVSVRSQVLNLMKRVQAANDLTYMIISHDLSVVRYMADRIGVMYLGKIMETGTSDEIYETPAHPYTAGLLEAIPLPDPAVAKKLAAEGAPIRGELPSPINPPSGCRFRTRCPRAQDLCAAEEPLLRSFGGEHRAACHFPLQEPVEQENTAAAS